MKLYLVRHGEVEGTKGRAIGQLDLPLSPAGAHRVRALADTWRGPAPDRLFASDLCRSVDSAQLLASRIGCALKIDPRLRELSFGHWEGIAWDEIHRQDGSRLAAWGERWWEVAPPGGETYADLSGRVLGWFEELAEEEGDTSVVLVVAHAGSLRALLVALLALPRSKFLELHLDYGHVSAVAATRRSSELIFLNQETFHGICKDPSPWPS